MKPWLLYECVAVYGASVTEIPVRTICEEKVIFLKLPVSNLVVI